MAGFRVSQDLIGRESLLDLLDLLNLFFAAFVQGRVFIIAYSVNV